MRTLSRIPETFGPNVMAPSVVTRTNEDRLEELVMLPLYLEGNEFVSPFCCYGNDGDCDLCGGWVVFHITAMLEGGGYPGPRGMSPK